MDVNLTMGFMETSQGHKIFPHDPDQATIDPIDIANSLSKQCRYNGHCQTFYSVAEHSFLLATWINAEYSSVELTLQALLHDATEAYLGDIIRPLKKGYLRHSGIEHLEKEWEERIMRTFDLPPEIHPAIHEADLGMLQVERRYLFGVTDNTWDYERPGVSVPTVDVKVLGWSPEQAREHFLKALLDWARAWSRRSSV